MEAGNIFLGIGAIILLIIGSYVLSKFGLPTFDRVLGVFETLAGMGGWAGILLSLGYFCFVFPIALCLYLLAGMIGLVAFPALWIFSMASASTNSQPSRAANTFAVTETQVSLQAVGVAVTVDLDKCDGCGKHISGAAVYRCKTCGQESCWKNGFVGAGGEGCMLPGNALNPLSARAQDTCPHCGAESNHPWSSNFEPVRNLH